MATPRAVARNLRRTATQVARIADTAVAEVAEEAVNLGASVGGRFGGRRGRSRLTVGVRDVRNRRGVSSATIAGETAGAWSIKSYGRRGGYTVRPRQRNGRRAVNLRGAGVSAGGRRITASRATSPGRMAGDDRWSRLIAEPSAERFEQLAGELLTEAVSDG